MMNNKGHVGDIAKQVCIAALSSLAGAFIMWGVETFKTYCKRPAKKEEEVK